MNIIRQQLIKRIRGELPDLDRTVQKALRGWQMTQRSLNDQDLYLDSVALNLQSFYSGLERIFELIARSVDQHVPDGDNWHIELLRQMALERSDIRPAIISLASATQLDEYRRFRHLVRNVYTANLQPERMRKLLSSLPNVWDNVQAEMLAYAELLQEIEDSSQ